MSTNGTLLPGTLTKTCYASFQELYLDMFSKGSVLFADTAIKYTIGATTPSADDRDKLWVQLNGFGAMVGVWAYYSGSWIRPHEVPASSSLRQLWVGSTGDLETFDGGTTDAVTDTTGPFWEVDTNFDAKFLVGPGNFAAAGTVSVNTDFSGGADQVTLTESQLPAHDHKVGVALAVGTDPGPADNTFIDVASNVGAAATTSGITEETGSGDPINIIPPSRGVYVIKRTARIYRVAS